MGSRGPVGAAHARSSLHCGQGPAAATLAATDGTCAIQSRREPLVRSLVAGKVRLGDGTFVIEGVADRSR
jgi:hypothetical protein